MTAVWGPLGWMTLHSVSTSYPIQPTSSEKQLMYSWLDMFRDTITCNYCKGHFTTMLANYRVRFPNMLDSRQNFAMFAFRAHNTVNARLSKPVYATLDECMAILKKNTENRSAADYRISYINHILRYWKTMQDITGVVAVKKILEMKKIEIDYISRLDTKFDVELVNESVVIPRSWVENHVEEPTPRQLPVIRFNTPKPRAGVQVVGGRIRLF
jgi:hypothetical protein